MSERMDKVVGKIGNIDNKVNNMEEEIVELKKSVSWKLIGMGLYINHDEYYYPGRDVTLAKCLGICTDKRSTDSIWNGMLFYPSGGWCYCVKNDVGHSPYNSSSGYDLNMHFRYE